jgi:diphthine-ammonia ligase
MEEASHTPLRHRAPAGNATEQGEPAVDRYAVLSSGGKDSILALDRAVRSGLHVTRLVTLYDEASERVRFHAVPIAVMRAQAEALALPIRLYPTTPATFEQVFLSALGALRSEGIGGLIFGDIHLADVRAWYEERVRAAGLEHLEPIWGEPPGQLVREVLARGYTAVLTCIEEAKTEPAWLGQQLSPQLIAAFEQRGIDPCGEYGEYHTLVTDGPLFRAPLPVRFGLVHVDRDPHTQGRFRQVDVQLHAQTSA